MRLLALSLLAFSIPQSAQAQDSGGGHYWQIVYTQTGDWSYADRDMPTTGQTTPHSGVWDTTGNGYGVGGGGQVDGSVSGTITATLTWIPATGQTLQSDPPPAQLNIVEYGDAWFGSNWGGSTMPDPSSGVADDGLGDAPVSSSNGYNTWTSTSQGYHATQQDASSGTVTVTGSPGASNPPSSWLEYPNYPGYYYWDWSAGLNSVSFSAYPVTLNLSGTTQDSSGNQDILIGQHCSASISGLPSFPSGYTVSYQWSVSGTTFQYWSSDTPAIGDNPYNPDASYEVDGPGPLTNATAGWYWNDFQAPTPETVSCTATVTPPAGQGSPFTVTATQKVTVYRPILHATGTGGNMQINTAIPNGNGTDFWLYAGPTTGTGEVAGMEWDATISPPNGTKFGAGSLILVQLIIPNVSYTENNIFHFYHSFSLNGQEGLDTAYPYPGALGSPNYSWNDSPGIDLTGTNAASANVSDQFEDYIMYFAPSSSQCVPLGYFVWSTNGNATIPGTGNWATFGAGSAGPITPSGTARLFGSSNSFPMWTQNDAVSNGHF